MNLDQACWTESRLLLPYVVFFMWIFIHSQTLPVRCYVASMQIEHIVEKRFLSTIFSCSVVVKGWVVAGSVRIGRSFLESLCLAKGEAVQSPQHGTFLSPRWILLALEGHDTEFAVSASKFPWYTEAAKVAERLSTLFLSYVSLLYVF